MKLILNIFYVFIFGTCSLLSQNEKGFSSEIDKVTVYTKGAQVERYSQIKYEEGITTVNLTGLSSCVNKESIKINGDSRFDILSVQLRDDFLNEIEVNDEVKGLRKQLDDIKNKIEDQEVRQKITQDKLDFVYTNKFIGGKSVSLTSDVYSSMNSLYAQNVEKLNLDLVRGKRNLEKLKKRKEDFEKQLKSLSDKTNMPSSTIVLNIDAKQSGLAKIKFSYMLIPLIT